MRLAPIVSIMALAATATADGKAITDAMLKIKSQTADVGTTVAKWRGDLLGALPITVKSTQLLAQLKSASRTASQSANLTIDEALTIAGTTSELAKTVQTTLKTIVDAKPKFDKNLILSPVVLLNLELEKDASTDFSRNLICKLPQELRDLAKTFTQPIDDAFAAAIEKYRIF